MEFHAGDLAFFKPLNVGVQITEVLKTGQILFKRLDETSFGLGTPNQFEKIVDFTENSGVVAMDIEEGEDILIISEDGTDSKEGRVLKRLKNRESPTETIEPIIVVEKNDNRTEPVAASRVVPDANPISGCVFNTDIFRRLIFAYKITPRNLFYMSLSGKAWNDRINNQDNVWRMMLERDFAISYTKWLTRDMELHEILKKAIDAHTSNAENRGRRYYKRFYELLTKMMQPDAFSFAVKEDLKVAGKIHLTKVFQCGKYVYGLFSSHTGIVRNVHGPYLVRLNAKYPFKNVARVTKPQNALDITAPTGFDLDLLVYDCDGMLYKLRHHGGHAGSPDQEGLFYVNQRGHAKRMRDVSIDKEPGDWKWNWFMNKKHIVFSHIESTVFQTFVYDRATLRVLKKISGIFVRSTTGPTTFSIADMRFATKENVEGDTSYGAIPIMLHNVLLKNNVNLDAEDTDFKYIAPLSIISMSGTEFHNSRRGMLDTKDILDTYRNMDSIEQQFRMKITTEMEKQMLTLGLTPSQNAMQSLSTKQKNYLINQNDSVDFVVDSADYAIRIYPGTASGGLWGYYTLKKDSVNLVSASICASLTCDTPSLVYCGKCMSQTYCSQTCANDHWRDHKQDCI